MSLLNVRFLPAALDDAIASQSWYESQQQGLGQQFAIEVARGVQRISSEPLMQPAVYGSVRRLVLRRFPYAIYYRLDGEELLVIAVHGRQDPRRWQGRS